MPSPYRAPITLECIKTKLGVNTWCNLRASFWVLSLARHTPFVKRPTRNPFSQDDSPIPRMDRLFKYLCIWSIKFLCIKIKDLVGSGKNCSLFKSSSSLMTELKFYVLLLVNDSERGMQICSYDTQASHGGKTQCYKCWGEMGVGGKSYLVPICQYILTRWGRIVTLFYFYHDGWLWLVHSNPCCSIHMLPV